MRVLLLALVLASCVDESALIGQSQTLVDEAVAKVEARCTAEADRAAKVCAKEADDAALMCQQGIDDAKEWARSLLTGIGCVEVEPDAWDCSAVCP